MTRRRAFVSGAGDFVGLHVVEQLLDADWEVIALIPPGTRSELLNRWSNKQPLTIFEGDAATAKSLRGLMPDRLDAVFNAVHHVSLWSREARAQIRANVQTTRHMVQVALERKARRFIHTSSIVAYGLHEGTITEDTPSSAASSSVNYVRTKAAAEREVRKGLRQGLPAVILNPSNMVGRYDRNGWARLFRLVDQGRMPIMASGGGSFCDVRAVAKAHVRAVDAARIGSNYLLGGADCTYAALLIEIAKLMQRRVLPRALPTGLLKGVARIDETLSRLLGRRPVVTRETVTLLSAQTYCKSHRAERELGYRPVPLKTMLEDCYRWLQDEGELRSP